VTILSPIIGYDKAAAVAHYAYEQDTSLREACIRLKYLSGEEFDRIVRVEKMLGP
jgi:fumarate hydratase, class II